MPRWWYTPWWKRKKRHYGSYRYIPLAAPRIDWEPEIEETIVRPAPPPSNKPKPNGPPTWGPSRSPFGPPRQPRRFPIHPPRTPRRDPRKPRYVPTAPKNPYWDLMNKIAESPAYIRPTKSTWEYLNPVINKHREELRPWYMPQGYDPSKGFFQNLGSSMNNYPKNFSWDKMGQGMNKYLFSQDAYGIDPDTGKKVANMFGITAKDAAQYLPWMSIPGLPGEGALFGTASKIFSKLFPRVTQGYRGAVYGLHNALGNLAGAVGGSKNPKWYQGAADTIGDFFSSIPPQYINDVKLGLNGKWNQSLIPAPKGPKGPKISYSLGKGQNQSIVPYASTWPLPYTTPPTATDWQKYLIARSRTPLNKLTPNQQATFRQKAPKTYNKK